MASENVIARELELPIRGVAAVLGLLEDKNTVPFIARYRKEATGGLDEVQIRAIEERRTYHATLEARRQTIIATITEQGAMTDELRRQLDAAATKSELEDLYLPYKRKRRTRAQMARERGLEPLAARILAQPGSGNPASEATAFIGPDVADRDAALAGARDIVAELVAESSAVRQSLRDRLRREGQLRSKPARGKSKVKSKFELYYDFSEAVAKIPSHRYLAIARGENEGFLSAHIAFDVDRAEADIARLMSISRSSPFAAQLRLAITDSVKRLLGPSLENEIRAELKDRSDRAAATVFGENLGKLLLAAPLGGKPVLGIDPGLRTGCKCAALDATGKFLENTTLYLSGSSDARERARRDLVAIVGRHAPEAIAIGNGTGSRETETFVRETLDGANVTGCVVVMVSESGASIYSASDIAREEFPDLDLTVRGAISIGRRLQDPLAELVKVDPKSIGVGQYQHDVDQSLLGDKLREVVETCVNRVGVDLNTASAALLSYVAGIARSVAKKIVAHREKTGAFATRKALLKVSGVGPRAFEQAAGFLRIAGAKNPLDASAVHPERYALVDTIAADLGIGVAALVGSKEQAARVEIKRYIGPEVGEPTLRDIVRELEKPGRDPREQFEAPRFRDDINDITDLVPDMELEGVVTNVTAFGAFVDIGVHQDGLVHISQLADRFVSDPNEVVGVGDRIRVRVISVEVDRKRISLTAKKERGEPAGRLPRKSPGPDKPSSPSKRREAPRRKGSEKRGSFSNNPFADLGKKR